MHSAHHVPHFCDSAGVATIHASCVVRGDHGLLLLGAPGSGKSDLALRLVDRGFLLVADDRVTVEGGVARPAAGLAGLVEIRGLGLLHLPSCPSARLALVLALDDASGGPVERLPSPRRHPGLGLPLLRLDPSGTSAALRAEIALDCAIGHRRLAAGGLPGFGPEEEG